MKDLFLFFLIFQVLDTTNPAKMNLIHGTPSEFTTSSKFKFTWDYCISYCYQMSTCLAAYYQDEFPEICEIFEIGNLAKIQKLNAYSGKIMAVKTTSPSECSLSSNDSLMFGTVSTESTWQNYSIQVSQDFWTIDSSPFFECPDNFKLWQRAKGMWCMGVGITKSSINPNFQFDGYWINGIRKESCRYRNQTGEDCDGIAAFDITDPFMSSTNSYIWGNGVPDGFENGIWMHGCLVFRVTSQGGAGVDDLPCTWTGNAKRVFLNGFICGVPPEKM
ncbi:unnamed protein product [Caenorhabditis nigoni]